MAGSASPAREVLNGQSQLTASSRSWVNVERGFYALLARSDGDCPFVSADYLNLSHVYPRLMQWQVARESQRSCRPLIQVGGARTRRVRAGYERLHYAARSRCL
jgi:hypothetical protein